MFSQAEQLIIQEGVICPECSSKGGAKVSITTTIAAVYDFTDEAGNYHEHDGNRADASCRCKNGHDFTIRLFNSCFCGWSQNGGKARWEYQKRGQEKSVGMWVSIREEMGRIVNDVRTFYRNGW